MGPFGAPFVITETPMAYAPISYTYSGTVAQKTVNLTFPIISRNHVAVYYGGTKQLNNNTVYQFTSDSQIVLVSPPAVGVLVKVARETPAEPLVNFVAGSVIPVQDLNTATAQALYRVEELLIDATTSVAYGDLVGVPSEFPPAPHFHDAAATFSTGVVPPNYLGTGARSASVFLRGDGVWAQPPSASGQWGTIAGTLASQTDLQTALNGKASTTHTHAIADIGFLQYNLDTKLSVAQAGTLGLTILGSATLNDARSAMAIYVQDTDPGVVPNGSIWISTAP